MIDKDVEKIISATDINTFAYCSINGFGNFRNNVFSIYTALSGRMKTLDN